MNRDESGRERVSARAAGRADATGRVGPMHASAARAQTRVGRKRAIGPRHGRYAFNPRGRGWEGGVRAIMMT